MKKVLLFALATTSAIAAYVLAKNCSCSTCSDNEHTGSKSQRHLTNAFSKAKQQSVS